MATSAARTLHDRSTALVRLPVHASESGASPAKCLHAVGVGLEIRSGSVVSRLSEAASLGRWTLPLFRERLCDSPGYRRCARERDVRHYGNRQSAFREREQGRHFFNPKMAIVTSRLNLLTRQRYGLELPAQPVARLLARSQCSGAFATSEPSGDAAACHG